MKIVLISCSSNKSNFQNRAKYLYASPLFKYSLTYAESLNPDKIYILSAKYGLLDLDDKVTSYNKTLKKMAKELVDLMRKNTTVDWTLRKNIRAKMRIYIKKLLKKYNYPPDKQEGATQLVLLQAETVCKDWEGK